MIVRDIDVARAGGRRAIPSPSRSRFCRHSTARFCSGPAGKRRRRTAAAVRLKELVEGGHQGERRMAPNLPGMRRTSQSSSPRSSARERAGETGVWAKPAVPEAGHEGAFPRGNRAGLAGRSCPSTSGSTAGVRILAKTGPMRNPFASRVRELTRAHGIPRQAAASGSSRRRRIPRSSLAVIAGVAAVDCRGRGREPQPPYSSRMHPSAWTRAGRTRVA